MLRTTLSVVVVIQVITLTAVSQAVTDRGRIEATSVW